MTEPSEDAEDAEVYDTADALAEAITERLLPVLTRLLDRAQRGRGAYHDDATCGVCIDVALARPIEKDSWLQEPRFAAFRAAYSYACGQTNAIGGLAKIDPEDAYHIWVALRRGVALAGGPGVPLLAHPDGAGPPREADTDHPREDLEWAVAVLTEALAEAPALPEPPYPVLERLATVLCDHYEMYRELTDEFTDPDAGDTDR